MTVISLNLHGKVYYYITSGTEMYNSASVSQVVSEDFFLFSVLIKKIIWALVNSFMNNLY